MITRFLLYLYRLLFAIPGPATRIRVRFHRPQKRKVIMFKLPVDLTAAGELEFLDSHGNTTDVDGDPIVTSSDTTILLAETTGHNTIKITGVSPGTAVVQVQVDVDRGDGVKPLLVSETVEVTAGEAVSGVLRFSAPTV